MKSLVLIELEYHNEVLRAYLLTLLETTYHISCLTTRFNYNQLTDFHGNPRVKFEIKQDQESYVDYFDQHKNLIHSAKAVVVITLPNNDLFFKKYKWPANCTIVIHNYHSVFCPSDKAKGVMHYFSYLLANRILGRLSYRDIAKQFDSFIVPSSEVLQYVKDSKHHAPMKLLGVGNFLINERQSKVQENSGKKKVVLPGSISQSKRDYKLLYNALDGIKTKLNKSIELNFLGTAKNKVGIKILDKFKDLESEHIKVVLHNRFISQEAYDQQIQEADFLLLPLLTTVIKQKSFKEKLGYSSVSGNIGDIAKYAIPAILPAFYPLDEALDKMVSRYTDTDSLGAVLLDWVNNCSYKDKKNFSEDMCSKYAPANQAKLFLETIERI